MKRIYIIILSFVLFSCSTKHHTDYVQLEIPEELKKHEDLVESLEKDAKKLNRLLNSVEDAATHFTDFKIQFDSLNENTDPDKFKEEIEDRVELLEEDYKNIVYNFMWFASSAIFKEKREKAIKNLTSEEIALFDTTKAHLSLKTDTLKAKFNEFVDNVTALDSILNSKDSLLVHRFNFIREKNKD